MRARTTIVAAVCAMALVLSVASAANGSGGTAITACAQVVTTNAFLTQDLYCPGTSGVVVGAGGIKIDLRGFKLRGDLTSNHYGVDDSAGYDGVSVSNGVVRTFAQGVYSNGGDKFSVSNVVASANLFCGVLILADAGTVQKTTADGNQVVGISIHGAKATVRSSTASGNKFLGMDMLGDASSVIGSSSADGNGDVGFVIGGNGVHLQAVTASGNKGEGFSALADGISIKSSTFSGNGGAGIYITGDAPVLKGNLTSGNGYSNGASDLSGLGINANGYTVPPVGTNIALGNDDPAECSPSFLC